LRTEKANYERAHPGRLVTYETKPEDHQVIYNPFKHDEYRYYCTLTERWDPVYKEAQSPTCGLAAAAGR
jgi:hypothetical protein